MHRCRSKQDLDSLVAANTKLTAETAHSKADLHDINEYLCNQLKATALTNATLSSRIDDLEQRMLESSRAHTVSDALSADYAVLCNEPTIQPSMPYVFGCCRMSWPGGAEKLQQQRTMHLQASKVSDRHALPA